MSPAILSILSVIAFLAYLQAGIFVFIRNPSVSVNRWFLVLTLTLALWSAGLIVYDNKLAYFGGFPLFLLSVAGAMLFPIALLKYFAVLSGFAVRTLLYKVILIVLIVACILLLIFSFLNTEILGARLRNGSDTYNPVFLWLAVAYFTYLILALSAIIVFFIEWRHRLDSNLEKSQYKFIRNALAASILFGFIVDILLPQLGIIENLNIAHLFGLVLVGFLTFGVFYRRLFTLTPELAAERVVMRSHKIIFFCNPSSWIFKTNPYTQGLLQLSENELLGRSLAGFFSDPLLILQTLHQAKRQNESEVLETQLVAKSGSTIPVRISFLFIKDAFTDLLGIIVYGQDMRETIALGNEIATRKQLEKELHALSEELENRVKEKTNELSFVHKKLQFELAERLHAEEKIKADSEEKELLIGEIHDRVKGNMELIIALILAECATGRHAADTAKLLELAQRVKTILLVHQNLYFSTRYSQVDFSHFVSCLVADLKQNAITDKNIIFLIDLQEAFLSFESALPLGLIVNELVTNALVHAWNHAGYPKHSAEQPTVWIQLYAADGEFTLKVRDNGVGLQEDFNLKMIETNGLPLVDILARDQIGGEFTLQSDNGVLAIVKFSEQ